MTDVALPQQKPIRAQAAWQSGRRGRLVQSGTAREPRGRFTHFVLAGSPWLEDPAVTVLFFCSQYAASVLGLQNPSIPASFNEIFRDRSRCGPLTAKGRSLRKRRAGGRDVFSAHSLSFAHFSRRWRYRAS